MNELYMGVLWYLVFIVSTSLHEASHALVAKWGGDRTAYEGGQASIDPLPHILREPMGMVVVPILSLLIYGWPIGYAHAPYDPQWAHRYPRRSALMALAGPTANFAIVLGAALMMHAGIAAGFFAEPLRLSSTHLVEGLQGTASGTVGLIVSIFFSMNLLLGTFNLLPVPPLDGSGLVPLFVPRTWGQRYQEFVAQPYMFMIGLVVAWQVFPKIYGAVYAAGIGWLYPSGLFR